MSSHAHPEGAGAAGVCVFDLDQTLTCGDAARAVRACRDQDYEIAVNTARPAGWLEPRLAALGLPAPHSSAFVHNPRSYRQTPAQRAEAKARGMDRIAEVFGTSNLILFDDLEENVNAARRAGYRAQHVSQNGQCGITEEDLRILTSPDASH